MRTFLLMGFFGASLFLEIKLKRLVFVLKTHFSSRGAAILWTTLPVSGLVSNMRLLGRPRLGPGVRGVTLTYDISRSY